MFLKPLVTGLAAAAVVAGGATSLTVGAAPAITPVVWGAPMPQTPAPELSAPLAQTLQALASGGGFSAKAPYIQGGIGRIESIAADRAYSRAAAEGKFPLTFNIVNIDDLGGVVNADVTATTALGATATENVQFVAGPSPTG
ncbi:MAG: hypothetical protein ACRDUB_23345, partial [Mycobacterium sp.]